MVNVKGKVVIVTCAGSGIGKVVAQQFGEKQAKVVCADIKGGEETAKEINNAGGSALGVHLDVSNLDNWNSAKEQTIQEFGEIDVLCNIAGISEAVDTIDLEEDFDKMININLKGTFFEMKRVIPEYLKNGSGKIVNIGSLAAHIGLKGLPSYSAAKGDVIAIERRKKRRADTSYCVNTYAFFM